MFNPTSAFITANGVRLHYYRTGGKKPPLVLVHGITDDGLCWTPVAAALQERWDVILLDVRGHGKSEAPEGGYTLRNLGADIAGLVQGLGLEKPAVLGHSMGAIAALVLAGLFPDLPRAILLEDPPPFWRSVRRYPQDQDRGNELYAWFYSVKRKTRDDLLEEARANTPPWQEAEIEPWVNAKHRFSLDVTALMQPEDLISIGWERLCRGITCQALFISASDPAKHRASALEDIAALQSLIPHMLVKPVADAGHSIRRDQFARYMKIVEQFLAGL